jgi:Holliday junction resolvase RusA-like endonuclease
MRPGQASDGDGEVFRYTDPKAAEGARTIKWEAKRAYGLKRPALGPVTIKVVAVFAIPVSWPPALRRAALEGRVWHTSDPDLDQLVKQVMDALKGVAFLDDNQVVGFHPSPAKRFGHPERTEISVTVVPVAEDEKTPAQRRREKRLAEVGWDVLLAPPPKQKKRSKTERQQSRNDAAVARVRAGGSAGRAARWRGRGRP